MECWIIQLYAKILIRKCKIKDLIIDTRCDVIYNLHYNFCKIQFIDVSIQDYIDKLQDK